MVGRRRDASVYYAVDYTGAYPSTNCPTAFKTIKQSESEQKIHATVSWNGNSEDIIAILRWFKANTLNDTRAELRFPIAVKKTHRALVHEHSRKTGLRSESSGNEPRRHVVVYSCPPSHNSITKNVKDETTALMEFAQKRRIDISKYNRQTLQVMIADDKLPDDIKAFWPPRLPDQVEWVNMNDESFGHFFVSKFAKEKYHDRPEELCLCLSLEDLFLHDTLQTVVLVSSERDSLHLCRYFPTQSNVTIVCPQVNRLDCNVTQVINYCYIHPDRQDGDSCCQKVQSVNVIYPVDGDEKLKTNFVILRYDRFIRFILCPTFDSILWENVLICGWYCDLPLNSDQDLDDSITESNFAGLFDEFLRSFNIDIEELFKHVDFSAMSPCVKTLASLPGGVVQEEGILHRLSEIVWPKDSFAVQVLQVTNTLPKMSKHDDHLTHLRNAFPRQQTNIKIVFPSNNSIESVDNKDIQEKLKRYFNCHDVLLKSSPHLLKSSSDNIVLANILMAFQSDVNSEHDYGCMFMSSHSMWDLFYRKEKHDKNLSYKIDLIFMPTEVSTAEGTKLVCPNVRAAPYGFMEQDFVPYIIEDYPFIGGSTDILHHFGQMKRYNHDREYGFIERVDYDGPTSVSCTPIPSTVPSVFIHKVVCTHNSHMPLPEKGTILEFLGHWRNSDQYKVSKVTKVLKSPDPLDVALEDRVYLDQVTREDFYSHMAKLGFHNDESIEELLQHKYRARKLLQRYERHDDAKTMEATKIQDRQIWLERHVIQVCGQVPKLEGPLRMGFLQLPLEMNRRQCFKMCEE